MGINYGKSNDSIRKLNLSVMYSKIESAVQKQQGVAKVNVLFHAGKVKAEINNKETSADKLSEVIEKLGYTVENTKVQGV